MSNDDRNTQKDFVDHLKEEWLAATPTLEPHGLAVIARIVRMSDYIAQRVDTNFAHYGLNIGEFEVLAALARHPQHQLTPKQLQNKILVSSGGLSNRVNRLEAKQLLVRLPDPSDRRGVIVQITSKGQEIALQAVCNHMRIENELVKGLNESDQQQLAALLKKLILLEENKRATTKNCKTY